MNDGNVSDSGHVKITHHASERYAERIMGIENPNSEVLYCARQELANLLQHSDDFVFVSNRKQAPLWCARNGAVLVLEHGVLFTVLSIDQLASREVPTFQRQLLQAYAS